MDKKKNTYKLAGSLFSAGGLGLMLVILVLVNLIISQVNIRWDATKDKLYSLSDGTKKILVDLQEEVSIKIFYTQDHPETPLPIKTYGQRMLDFVSEYEYYSNGKIHLEVYNPKPDSEEEEWAQKYGIEGINLPSGENLYFGLVGVAADQEETIKILDPTREEHLEYDISRMIYRLQSPKKRKIGVISSFGVMGKEPNYYNQMSAPTKGEPPWLFIKELKKNYFVEKIDSSAEAIDDDTDLVLMIHPKNMSEQLMYAVDQFVLKGGNVITYIDPFAVMDTGTGPMKSSNPEKLLSAWGVSMDPTKMLIDFDYVTRLRGQNNQVENNPMWISISGDGFNSDEIITSKLESVLLPIVGALKKTKDSNYEYETLLQSSKNSALTDVFKVRFGVEQLRRDFSATVEQYDLAVKIRGKFKTAFAGGKPKTEDAEQAEDKTAVNVDEHLNVGQKKAAIIVVADSDMLGDNFYVSKQNFLGFDVSRIFNDNLNLLLNTMEMLTGSDALISIRSRGKFDRPFTKVKELEKAAQERWMAREQELVRKVEETNRKLTEFERKKDQSQKYIVSQEQEAEIKKFKFEKRRINKELKKVRRNLRVEIESLGNLVKFINIGLMPLLVCIGGIIFWIYRRRKSIIKS